VKTTAEGQPALPTFVIVRNAYGWYIAVCAQLDAIEDEGEAKADN